MRVNQAYFGSEDTVLTARCSFKQFTLITYSLQNRNTRKKNVIAKISKKGFHPSCILELSCRRWHQVPLKNCIMSAVLSDATWTLLPLNNIQECISIFKQWDVHANGKTMISCIAPTFQGQWKGWRMKATLPLQSALLMVYAKKNDIFFAKWKQPVNCRKSN